MCTHYRAPNETEELNQLRLPFLGPLYDREPWKQEIYPDYLAPIVRAAGDGVEAVLTVNAEKHEVMKRMHRPGDGKRSVVILGFEDYAGWLHLKNSDAARPLLKL
nr:hypothetical protein [Burkholderia gladioli]